MSSYLFQTLHFPGPGPTFFLKIYGKPSRPPIVYLNVVSFNANSY